MIAHRCRAPEGARNVARHLEIRQCAGLSFERDRATVTATLRDWLRNREMLPSALAHAVTYSVTISRNYRQSFAIPQIAARIFSGVPAVQY